MKTEIGAYEAKTRLPELLRAVKAGQRFTITNRGRAIADLVPSEDAERGGPPAVIEKFRKFIVLRCVVPRTGTAPGAAAGHPRRRPGQDCAETRRAADLLRAQVGRHFDASRAIVVGSRAPRQRTPRERCRCGRAAARPTAALPAHSAQHGGCRFRCGLRRDDGG